MGCGMSKLSTACPGAPRVTDGAAGNRRSIMGAEMAQEWPIVEGKFQSLKNLIGNTPLAAIKCKMQGREFTIYAKLEMYNLTGSIKDRMAFYVVRSGYNRGLIVPGDTICEASSGNTGIALAAIGSALNHPVRIYMPDWMSKERIAMIQSYGAEVVLISHEEGGFRGSINKSKKNSIPKTTRFLSDQFSTGANVLAHFTTTGPEIAAQLKSIGASPCAFVAGVGTGGTVMGCLHYFREAFPGRPIAVHPVEPTNSPILTNGVKVDTTLKHRIQGISDEFVPSIVDLSALSSIVSIPDGDAILMAQRLAKELGIGVGISSGCNFLAALHVAQKFSYQGPVVTIFCDDQKKYLSTDLTKDEPVLDGYMTPTIELVEYDVIRCPVEVPCIEPSDWTGTVSTA
eukprot:NODE_5993_length_1714_cov_8.175173.p1 GENE.NODE_5993_length_1714_cov_8.175173~~NODE_5993_length_1714_cov_8.175173.p1  ORF type:complete len:399 (+),score=62.07 NODE_5993_length_1714_cov_8.175173:108-1304(+)